MDLTWRDAVSTLAMAVMLIIYGAYLTGGFWLITSTWANAAVLLLVGLGGRVISAGGKAADADLFHGLVRVAIAVFGIIALVAGLTALVLSSGYALRIFIMSSIVTWGGSVFNHV